MQAAFAATLFDEWVRAGLRDVVISPGSRSTPLVLAAADRAELTLHVRLDERGAGFFALGRSLVTDRPVVVIVTSGTAAAELHACVAEADLARVALLVVTADRPPELHGVGAPQTTDQGRLYGAMVREFVDPGVARREASATWRPLAARLWHRASGAGSSRGPVHLNVPLAEPFDFDPGEAVAARSAGRAWRSAQVATPPVTTIEVAGRAVLAVVGPGAAPGLVEECSALNWVVLADATARASVPYFDALLRVDNFAERMRPELVVRLGGMPASKVLAERLRTWGVSVVGLSGAGAVADPDGVVEATFEGVPHRGREQLRANEQYARAWHDAASRVEEWLAEMSDDESALNEPLVARVLVELSASSGAPLVVGSSMPVRDVEWWAPARGATTFANRGASGIDGVVSTALGVSAGSRALALVGDLTMLHDVSALVDGVGEVGGTCVIVVVNNDGGGIFSFLDQGSRLSNERFERLFATARHHRLDHVAAAFGHASTTVATVGELRRAVDKGLAGDGVSVVVANVPSRDLNVALHRTWNSHVATLVTGHPE